MTNINAPLSEPARRAVNELITAELADLFDQAVAVGADRDTLHATLDHRSARVRESAGLGGA